MNSVDIRLRTRDDVKHFSKAAASIEDDVILTSGGIHVDGKDTMDIYGLNLLRPMACSCDDSTFLKTASSRWGV